MSPSGVCVLQPRRRNRVPSALQGARQGCSQPPRLLEFPGSFSGAVQPAVARTLVPEPSRSRVYVPFVCLDDRRYFREKKRDAIR